MEESRSWSIYVYGSTGTSYSSSDSKISNEVFLLFTAHTVWSSFSIPRYLLMVYHHRCSAIREMELELPLQLRSSLEVAVSLERVVNAAF
jgi:hypothetical protein